MDEQTQKAFDHAQGCIKQLINLATGTIALSITFGKDFLTTISAGARCIALWSWGLFLLSVFFGLWALLALTGSLSTNASAGPSIRGINVVLPAILQIFTFVGGLALTVLYGAVATGVFGTP